MSHITDTEMSEIDCLTRAYPALESCVLLCLSPSFPDYFSLDVS